MGDDSCLPKDARALRAEASANAARQSVKMNSQTETSPDVRR